MYFVSTGTHKSNRGWTPLHLAAYFGHKEVVKMLLEVCVWQVSNHLRQLLSAHSVRIQEF